MAELTDAQIDAALGRGRQARLDEPRACAARYDPKARKITVDLTNGASFAFPTALVTELANAEPASVAAVQVLGTGYGLHWETLDLDLTVPGLLADLFGTRAHLARRAGLATSPAKAAAARANGAKGGRPRKTA
ncbi:DUF2442 domain-containing protein [Caulobacter segnis]|uniref:DUF2442 domain-containing protein n=1 Tax=Caulobacter segnis TaxID=88688 RepID=A0A2W5VKG5_9CAUL|nr:DUF2442 domain-containing protein [Caulobacter segnis]PZR35815.1 MAG: DUF2442 domain-containing protein [Caulobacter segnis]